MAGNPSGRHQSYHELVEQLAAPGCAVCHLSLRAVDRYLDGLDWELVNDPAIREQLRRSRGFCRPHMRRLAMCAGRLPLAILTEDLLRHAEASLEGWARAPRSKAPAPCAACEVIAEQEETSLGELARRIEEPEVRAAYTASSGLCLPHTLALCRRLRDRARRRVVEIERERLRRLTAELAEVRRKHDYRAAGEPWGEEKHAPDRAVAKLAGERGA